MASTSSSIPSSRTIGSSIELNELTAEQSLEMVMQAAGHFYKVLDEHTIIVADDTPQNRREYEDLVIKTFFLSNADVKDVDKLLRSLIEARRLSTNEQLNAITLRDTADKVAIAEKLIRVNDKAKAEVLVDVEILHHVEFHQELRHRDRAVDLQLQPRARHRGRMSGTERRTVRSISTELQEHLRAATGSSTSRAS